MRVVQAIWRKEWIVLKSRLLFPIGFAVTLITLGLLQPMRDARYIPAVVGLATSLMSLKFWEERGQGTLDTLLSLPASTRSIFLAKSSFSAMVGLVFSFIAAIATMTFDVVVFRTLNWTVFTVIPIVAALSFGACVIVGFVMWSLSIQAAKVAQMAIFVLLGVGFASAFSGGVGFLPLIIISVVLLLFGIICICAVRTERIVLNLE